jgi:16S rRNA (guanine966-N2)-methyltransferase
MARGITLDAPKGRTARPTAARAREALFGSLAAAGAIQNATVVDLFAGTGALGLEAASRGAARVFLVERAAAAASAAKRNAAKVAKAGVGAEIAVLRGDAAKVARLAPNLKGRVDLILADPPYADSRRLLDGILPDADFAEWAAGSAMVWEVPDDLARYLGPETPFWSVTSRRGFGGAAFIFLENRIASDRGFRGE